MCSASTCTTEEMRLHISQFHSLVGLADKENMTNCVVAKGPFDVDVASQKLTIMKTFVKSGEISEVTHSTPKESVVVSHRHILDNNGKLRAIPTLPYQFQCLVCHHNCSTAIELMNHVQCKHVRKSDSGEDKELLEMEKCGFCCTECGVCYDTLELMLAHYVLAHPPPPAPSNRIFKEPMQVARLCLLCLRYYRKTGKWYINHRCYNGSDVVTKEAVEREANKVPCFLCDLCAATFRWKFHYRFHRETSHRGVSPINWDMVKPAPIAHLCDICHKGFKKERSLHEHECDFGAAAKSAAPIALSGQHTLNSSSKLYPIPSVSDEFPCKVCPQKCHTTRELIQHVERNHVRRPGSGEGEGLLEKEKRGYCCPECGLLYDTFELMLAHYALTHPPPAVPSNHALSEPIHSARLCLLCLCYYRSPGRWYCSHHCRNQRNVVAAKDLEREANKAPCFLCDVCAATFRWKFHYRFHRETRHRSVSAIDWDTVEPAPIAHVCDACEKGFKEERSWREHKCGFGATAGDVAHMWPQPKKRACPHCDMRFVASSSLYYHVTTKHKNEKVPPRKRGRQKVPTIECPFCTLKFKISKTMLLHAQNVHSRTLPSPFYCGVCDEIFRDNWTLKKHKMVCLSNQVILPVCELAKRRTAQGELYYACKSCAQKFTEQRDYYLHYRKHQRERYQTCEYCGSVFKNHAALLTHHRFVHKDECSVNDSKSN